MQYGILEPDTSTAVPACILRYPREPLQAAFQYDALGTIASNIKLSEVDEHCQRLHKLDGPALDSLEF